MNAKAELRSAALARRDAIGPETRRRSAERVAAAGAGLMAEHRAACVSGYWPIRSEADPRPLMERARDAGASIALPVVTHSGTLRFRLWEAGDDLVPAGFGTFGAPEWAPEVVPDLMIVPMAAFDRDLHRIGYGKGHYDRAIASLVAAGRKPLLVGLAFAVQEVEKVPFEPHDIPLDFILTEDELIAAPPRG